MGFENNKLRRILYTRGNHTPVRVYMHMYDKWGAVMPHACHAFDLNPT